MECERLNRLVRSWYVQVQEESLAPARMIEFMEKHLKGCGACLVDPDVRAEVKKIAEIVLPPSKMIKAARDDDDEEETDDSPSPFYTGEVDPNLSVDEGEEEEFIPEDDEDDL